MLATVGVAAATAACGSQKISVAESAGPVYHGAVLFAQRCAGCHTISAAGTHGSASNVRDRESINGPNFDVRCERPITRVVYAIENGGFGGGKMPQNIVIGQDARDVAMFVSHHAGEQGVYEPGSTTPPCAKQPIGAFPATASTASPAAVASVSAPSLTQAPAGGASTHSSKPK